VSGSADRRRERLGSLTLLRTRSECAKGTAAATIAIAIAIGDRLASLDHIDDGIGRAPPVRCVRHSGLALAERINQSRITEIGLSSERSLKYEPTYLRSRHSPRPQRNVVLAVAAYI